MNKKICSYERRNYIKKRKIKKYCIFISQIMILIIFIYVWEKFANKGIIDEFITSKPSRIWTTIINLKSNGLLKHIGVTVYETVLGFLLGTIIGIIIAIILWWSEFLSKVIDPYLVVLNSLPKVALRTNYYNLGGSRYFCNNCYGYCYFISSYDFRKLKWIYKN